MEVDFSRLDFATATKVDQVMRGSYEKVLLDAAARQRRVAFLNHLHRPLAKDGFGGRSLMVDPVFDAFWRECYGKHYLQDESLVKFLIKRNPEIAVKSRGTKEIFVGWQAATGIHPGSTSRKPVGLTPAEKNWTRTA